MDKNELDGLLVLKVVADKRSFRAAADELNISPAAISKMIKQVEKRLGATLLSRTTRSTRLTEVGEKFLNQAGPAINEILSAVENIGRFAEKPSGHLRIALPRATYHPFIQPLFAGFSKEYPDITVELNFADQTQDIVAEGFDAGIRYSDILDKDMVAVRISNVIRFIVVGSRKYLERQGRPKHPKELSVHNCIRLRFGNTSIYDRWEFEHKGRDLQVQVKGTLIMNDPLLLLDAARAGFGLVYTVEDSVRDDLKTGKLEEVLQAYAPTSSGFYLYYPHRSQVQPKLRAFIDHVQRKKS